MTRERLVDAGPVALAGKAGAGHGGVTRVEVSVDGGATWSEAELGESGSPYAWRSWTFLMGHATPGEYTLYVRASNVNGQCAAVGSAMELRRLWRQRRQRVDVVVR